MNADLTWEVGEALGTPVLFLHCRVGNGVLLRLDPVAWGMLGLLAPCCRQDFYADYAVPGRLMCEQCGEEYWMTPPVRVSVSDEFSYSYEFEHLELWLQWAGLPLLEASLVAMELASAIRQVLAHFTPSTTQHELTSLLPSFPTKLGYDS